MSLILGYADEHFGIIMSDGRAGTVNEYYDKTRKINNKLIIGFSGYAEEIEFTLKTIIDAQDDKESITLDDFASLLKYAFQDIPDSCSFNSSFLLIGLDDNNIMSTCIFGHTTDFTIQKNICNKPRICSIGGTIEGNIINMIYTTNMHRNDISIMDRMRYTITDVSKLDPSVNQNCFYRQLYKN